MTLPGDPETNCPMLNMCETTSLAGLNCNMADQFALPMLTAEALCVKALEDRRRIMLDRSANEQTITGRMGRYVTLAWLELETGVAKPDIDQAKIHGAVAMGYASRVLEEQYALFRSHYRATTLRAYGPMILSRKYMPPTEGDVLRTRHQASLLYDATAAAPLHPLPPQHVTDAMHANEPHTPCIYREGERIGLMGKQIGIMLAARGGVLLYPASNRESSSGGDSISLSHDAYMLKDGQKRAVKFVNKQRNNTEHRGNSPLDADEVARISHLALLNRALRNLRLHRSGQYEALLDSYGDQGPDVKAVAGLLQAELQGRLSQAETGLLDMMSGRVRNVLVHRIRP